MKRLVTEAVEVWTDAWQLTKQWSVPAAGVVWLVCVLLLGGVSVGLIDLGEQEVCVSLVGLLAGFYTGAGLYARGL